MKQIDGNADLVQMDGNPIMLEDGSLTVARALAQVVIGSKHADPLKGFELGMKINKGGMLQFENSEINDLNILLDKQEVFRGVLISGQLKKALAEATVA